MRLPIECFHLACQISNLCSAPVLCIDSPPCQLLHCEQLQTLVLTTSHFHSLPINACYSCTQSTSCRTCTGTLCVLDLHFVSAARALCCAVAFPDIQGLLGGEQPSLVAYTSSILASMGGFAFPTANVYAYRASKAALNMLVVTSAQELASRNITSVTLHPGRAENAITPARSPSSLYSSADHPVAVHPLHDRHAWALLAL